MRGFLVPLEIPFALLRKSGNDVGGVSGNDVEEFKELPWAGSRNNRGGVQGTTVGGVEELPWAGSGNCRGRSRGVAGLGTKDSAYNVPS